MKYKQFFKQYESINKSCEDLLSAYSYIFHLGKTDYLYFYFYYNPQYSSKIGIYYNSKWHEQEYIEFSLGLLDFDYEQARDFFRQFKDEEEQKYRKQQAEEKENRKH